MHVLPASFIALDTDTVSAGSLHLDKAVAKGSGATLGGLGTSTEVLSSLLSPAPAALQQARTLPAPAPPSDRAPCGRIV